MDHHHLILIEIGCSLFWWLVLYLNHFWGQIYISSNPFTRDLTVRLSCRKWMPSVDCGLLISTIQSYRYTFWAYPFVNQNTARFYCNCLLECHRTPRHRLFCLVGLLSVIVDQNYTKKTGKQVTFSVKVREVLSYLEWLVARLRQVWLVWFRILVCNWMIFLFSITIETRCWLSVLEWYDDWNLTFILL